MQNLFFVAALMVSGTLLAQPYVLLVDKGYGSGQYAAGDTVHIWSDEWSAARSFSHWAGDTAFLERPLEWHTRVIMPPHDLSVTANTVVLPTGSANPLVEESIQGRDTLKRVFRYFPQNAPPKGVCWLWHGTGGSASSWAGTEFEQHQFVKYLVSKGWGVIVTESEESTKHRDLSGDGNIRYDYFPDTLNNVDLQNVRAIRDTFIRRGYMDWQTPQASLGFSAGGAFSTLLASILHWKAAVTHCSAGVDVAIQNTTVPILFSMNLRDNHPDVGAAGNLKAMQNAQFLADKGLCSQFFLLSPSPTYTARFKRMPGISTSLSYSIHNELVANGCFGQGGYLIKTPDEIENAVIANPANWPVAVSLSQAQRQFVLDQLNVLWSSHHFHSDYMAADFAFLSAACATPVSAPAPAPAEALRVFPNPADQWLYLPENAARVRVFDWRGAQVLYQPAPEDNRLDVTALSPGMYVLELDMNGQRRIGKWIKL